MITIDSEEKNTQQSILRKHFEMLYPDKLKDDEWIRLVGIRKLEKETKQIIEYVKTFDEYFKFVQNNKLQYDLYNQLAINRNTDNGTLKSQRCRKVLYLDFDLKDFDHLKNPDAEKFTDIIKAKFPKLFLHACVNSGHGHHIYISIKKNCSLTEIAALNKEMAKLVGADVKAALSTQIARIPCTYNHKMDDGTYDYNLEHKDKWEYVKVVYNAYGEGEQFRVYDLKQIRKIIDDYYRIANKFELREKIKWDYTKEKDKCYFCVKKVMNEGIEKGQRNFWHGRIVQMYKEEGKSAAFIYQKCREYNLRCNPPKDKKELDRDTTTFLQREYKLLGCYNVIPDKTKSDWVAAQCDENLCDTFANGAKISVDEDLAVVNKKILTNRDLRKMKGNDYLVITILYFYRNSYGRRGFRIRNLKDLLFSQVTQKYCISDKTLKLIMEKLVNEKWITLTPDRKEPEKYWEQHIGLTEKIINFQRGPVTFYFTVSVALIDGKITQREYVVFLTLARNISNKKCVTYEQLSDDLNMDKHNIQTCISNLQKAHCLIVNKSVTNGTEYNYYNMTSPGTVFEENIHLAV